MAACTIRLQPLYASEAIVAVLLVILLVHFIILLSVIYQGFCPILLQMMILLLLRLILIPTYATSSILLDIILVILIGVLGLLLSFNELGESLSEPLNASNTITLLQEIAIKIAQVLEIDAIVRQDLDVLGTDFV